jgi:hypothetical protein
MAFSAVLPLPLLAWLLRPHIGPAERLARALTRANGSSFTQAVITQRGGGSLVRGGAVLLAAGAAGTFALPHLIDHSSLPGGASAPRAAPGLTTSSGSGALHVLSGGDGLPAANGSATSSTGSLPLLAAGEPELATHEFEDGGLSVARTDLLEPAARNGEPRDPSERPTVRSGGSGDSHVAAPAGSDASTLTTVTAPADASGSTAGSESTAPASDSSISSAAQGSSDTTTTSAGDGSSSQDSSSQSGTATTSSSDN